MKIYEVRIKTPMRQMWEFVEPIIIRAESPKDAAKIINSIKPIFAL